MDKENQQDGRVLRESNGGLPDSPEPVSISTAARKAALMLAEQQQYSLRHSITSLPHNSCDGLRLSGTWLHICSSRGHRVRCNMCPTKADLARLPVHQEDTAPATCSAPPRLA